MKTVARFLLIAAALAGSFREAGAAACRSACPMEGVTAVEASACATACAASGDASACPLPCDPVVPCPLLDPAPPVVFEKSSVARGSGRPAHDSIGPHTLLPEAVLVPGDLDVMPYALRAAPPGVPRTRPRLAALWLVDRALLI